MDRMNLAGVLWDMDGTIIDSEPLWVAAEERMLARFGITLTAGTKHRLVGIGLWDAAEIMRDLGVPMSADDIVAEWVAEVEAGLEASQPKWRPGARELLVSLRDAGIPCALVTMSVRSLAEQVARMLPEGVFTAVVAGDEVTHAKPHPEPYLLGAAALGVAIECCLVIEDSPTGLRSGYAAGAVTVGVPNLVSLADALTGTSEVGVHAHALWSTLAGVTAAGVRSEFAAMQR